ncbi:alpha/beta hydrolase [Niveibacterium sp. SC-1]|uniref:alpha/beta hydrolase n=1 Tax=Niveibacterium sp. SC-1 TaxID=3135646 RepID=UPI00311ECBC5
MSPDPRAQIILAAAYRPKAVRMWQMDVAQARHAFFKLCAAYGAPAEVLSSMTDKVLARPPALGGPLRLRVYRPLGAAPGEVLPAVLWIHGGGWTLGTLDDYDVLCRTLCNHSGAAVLALDYRLAPEHPYPAAVEDAQFALDWLAARTAELNIDPARIAIAGDSAGGNLAAVTAIATRDAGWPRLCAQVLAYPATDQLSQRPSHRQFADGFLLDEATIRWFQNHYLPDPELKADWQASPLWSPRLDGLPPALVLIAACDVLADDGRAYADALRAAGTEAWLDVLPGMIHGFLNLGRLLPDAGSSLARIGAWLREVFSRA